MLMALRLGLSKAKAINIIQREAHEDSKRPLQRSKGLARTHAEEGKKERNAKKEIDRLADDGRHDPCAVPIDNAMERNLKDAAEGKEIKRTKLYAKKFVPTYHWRRHSALTITYL
jgi:hypothetical protein